MPQVQPECLPHEGQATLRRLSSSAFFARPAFVINQALTAISISIASMCGSIATHFRRFDSLRMGMRSEVQLPAPPIGYVGVQLGRRQIRVAEHLLDGAEVGSALEEVRREGVAEQVWVHPLGLQARRACEPAKDEEGARAGQPAATGIEEELGAVAAIEVRPAA